MRPNRTKPDDGILVEDVAPQGGTDWERREMNDLRAAASLAEKTWPQSCVARAAVELVDVLCGRRVKTMNRLKNLTPAEILKLARMLGVLW